MEKITEVISRMEIKVYKNGMHILDEGEKDFFTSFLEKMDSSSQKKYIYRGNHNLISQYKTDTNDLPLLSEKIFMVGEKGKNMWQECDTNIEEKKDIIDALFENLEKKLREYCGGDNASYFIKKNLEMCSYFTGVNRDDFRSKITQKGEKIQQEILDYYYVFLHTLDSNHSEFLSTSENLQVANRFRNRNGIILVGWVPAQEEKKRIIKYIDVNGYYADFVKEVKLPQWHSVYQNEQEICLKCGLLPHYMIGFITYIENRECFVINPAILKKDKRGIDDIILDGLVIDQSSFFESLKTTQYKGYYMFADGEYYRYPND